MNRISYGRWLIVLFLAVACLSPTAALASNKGIEVPCRVEPNAVSLSILDGAVDYGALAVAGTKNTALYNDPNNLNGMSPADTQTVTYTSTGETVDFEIKSSNATGGTADWTLAASTGASNDFTHKASLDGGNTWPVAMIVADGYVTLYTGAAAGGTVDFDLQIGMPTSITTDYGAHDITVTVLATQQGG